MKKNTLTILFSITLLIILIACGSGNVTVKDNAQVDTILTGSNNTIVKNYINLIEKREDLEENVQLEERYLDSITRLILNLEKKFSVFNKEPLTKKQAKENKARIDDLNAKISKGKDRKSILEESLRLNKLLIEEAEKNEVIQDYKKVNDSITPKTTAQLETKDIVKEPDTIEIEKTEASQLPPIPENSSSAKRLFPKFQNNMSSSQLSAQTNINRYKDSMSLVTSQLRPIEQQLNTLFTAISTAKTSGDQARLSQLEQQSKLLNTNANALYRKRSMYKLNSDYLTYLLDKNSKTKLAAPNSRAVVRPKDGKELLEALKSNTRIVLQPIDYDISPSKVGTIQNEKITSYENVFRVENVRNLEIVSDGGTAHVFSNIINVPVLTFYNVEGLSVKNIKLGHDGFLTEADITCGPGGDVIEMQNTFNAVLDGVSLYGCGVQGMDLFSCGDITLKNSRIYDCTNGAITSYDSYDLIIENCNISNNSLETRSIFEFFSSKNIYMNNLIVNNNKFKENDYSQWNDTALLSNYFSESDIFIENSTISENAFDYFSFVPDAFSDNNNSYLSNEFIESRYKETN